MPVSTSLPKSITDYFSAVDRREIDAILRTFVDIPTVKDEGTERQGPEAIRDWFEETTKKYNPTFAVIDAEAAGGRQVVTVRVAGTFPGSPVELRYAFTLAGGGKISRLEITA